MKQVAAIQMASGPNVGANLIEAGRLISDAVAAGAQLVVLPENFAHMGVNEADVLKIKEQYGEGEIQDFLKDQASKHGIWLVAGSIPLMTDDGEKVRSACLILNDQGEVVARYDKIHLFDVSLADGSESYAESTVFEPGNEVVVVETPFGKMGVAICYDLRFPELFRELSAKGADFFVVPSAFTAITGKAHWEIIVRTRAVENLCYMIAAAQGGYHVSGRATHGHSMIIDPWGGIMDSLASGSGFVLAELDKERLQSIRNNFPALEHRRV
jgi:nitrilase